MSKQNNNQLRILLVYCFVYSLLFTGVLRKWVFPEFSNVLVILPQIFTVLICVCLRKDIIFSIWEKIFFWCGVCVFFTTLFFGHQNIFVGVYGCLPYWFGLTSCAILGKVIHRDDIISISKIFVYVGIVNCLIVIIQFYSPALSEINAGNELLKNATLETELACDIGGFRPSGIFPHGSQSTVMQTITFAILLYNLFVNRYLNKWVCYTAIIIELIALPFSISRTNIFYHIGIAVFFLFTCFTKKEIKKRLKYIIPSIAIVVIGLFTTSIGRKAVNTMSTRFANAASDLYHGSSTMEGTFRDIVDRNVVYNIKALINPTTIDGKSVPFWGYGQGISTQIGGRLFGLDAQEHSGFALAEWDGLRIMCESGFVFGWIFIFVRLRYAIIHLFHIGEMKEKKLFLALTLLPSFLLAFNLTTTWGNIFLANMSFLTAGLFLASLRYSTTKEEDEEHEEINPVVIEEAVTLIEDDKNSEDEDQHSVVRGENPLA